MILSNWPISDLLNVAAPDVSLYVASVIKIEDDLGNPATLPKLAERCLISLPEYIVWKTIPNLARATL